MYTRNELETLCKNKRLNQDRADTVYCVLKEISTSPVLFSDVSGRIFRHADPGGRDSILRALGHSVGHVELEKLLCPDQQDDIQEISKAMALKDFNVEKQQTSAQMTSAQIASAQDELFSYSNPTPLSSPEGSPTPDPTQRNKNATWIVDQSTFATGHQPERKRGHLVNRIEGYSSTFARPELSGKNVKQTSTTRPLPKRSCKSTTAAQNTLYTGETARRRYKIAKPEGNQPSTTPSIGNVRPCRSLRLRREALRNPSATKQ